MIENVMPKAPFEAIRYTGDNAQEIEAFGHGAFRSGGLVHGHHGEGIITELCRSDGARIEPGTWIVSLGDVNHGPSTFLLIRGPYFREHWTTLPQCIHISDDNISEEDRETLKRLMGESDWHGLVQPMEISDDDGNTEG